MPEGSCTNFCKIYAEQDKETPHDGGIVVDLADTRQFEDNSTCGCALCVIFGFAGFTDKSEFSHCDRCDNALVQAGEFENLS